MIGFVERRTGAAVPLLLRYPPRIPAGVRVAEPVSTLGVFATIFDLAGPRCALR